MPPNIIESVCDGYDRTEHDFEGDTVEVLDADNNRMDLCPSCLAVFYLDNPQGTPRTLEQALEELRLIATGQSSTMLAEDARLIQLRFESMRIRLDAR